MANMSLDGTLQFGGLMAAETASTAATLSSVVPSNISSTAAQAYAAPVPSAGMLKIITKTSSSTAVQTVSATAAGTAANFGLTGVTLTFSAADQAVILYGISGTKWEIISNVGSVAVS